MSKEGYEGFKNFETWQVANWITDYASDRFYEGLEEIHQEYLSYGDADEHWIGQQIRNFLRRELNDNIDIEALEDQFRQPMTEYKVFLELMFAAAWDRVDWNEIGDLDTGLILHNWRENS